MEEKHRSLKGGHDRMVILSLDSEMFLNLSSRSVLITCPPPFHFHDPKVNFTVTTLISRIDLMSILKLKTLTCLRLESPRKTRVEGKLTFSLEGVNYL